MMAPTTARAMYDPPGKFGKTGDAPQAQAVLAQRSQHEHA